jgi:hypothetical protein
VLRVQSRVAILIIVKERGITIAAGFLVFQGPLHLQDCRGCGEQKSFIKLFIDYLHLLKVVRSQRSLLLFYLLFDLSWNICLLLLLAIVIHG